MKGSAEGLGGGLGVSGDEGLDFVRSFLSKRWKRRIVMKQKDQNCEGEVVLSKMVVMAFMVLCDSLLSWFLHLGMIQNI